MFQPRQPRRIHFLLPGLLFIACNVVQNLSAQTNDLSGQTDDSIRNVITLVANRQKALHGALADGNYATVTTISAAQAATKPTGIFWDYTWGVTLYGMLQAKNATGNTNIENFVLNHNLICGRYYSWLAGLKSTVSATPAQFTSFYNTTALRDFMALGKLDYCGSMTATLLEGAMQHAAGLTTQQVQVGTNTAGYITNGQPRLPDGTLWRPEREYTIWADDLYQSCPFLIRWYQYTGNTNLLNDAATQVMNMAGYLQDTNGLWFHGYYYSNSIVNGYKWGRANGWIVVTTAEVLSIMPTNHPARSNLLSILRRHIAGLESVQATSGLWHQVLDHPETYEETSASAMFAYAIARAANRGWVDPTNMAVARKAFVGVAAQISTNGFVNGVCPGTHIETNLSYYQFTQVPQANFELHGPGPVMLAGAEILLNPKLTVMATNEQAVVSWNAGISNATLETTTNLADWAVFGGSVVVSTNWQRVATETLADRRFYRLRLP